MAEDFSLGDVALAASQAKHVDRLLVMPTKNLTPEQAFSWPLFGIVEREPSKPKRWRMTAFGLAVRARLQQANSRSANPDTGRK
ncbi:hypothetical protein SAQ01S_07250 [Sphingomonas aquatilis NBRC 16722]|uniref:Uncharacterized protein n=1 Tax=Sphingomonas aquatilis TaxID=93063 RepID=A0AAW3TSP5_9SPHN|nr:hypothetical protein [Sphingomonas aquatilis]MBB3876106.1 hypothetical protein [Sphingomonas aquatilis]GEM70959.1 hypothetical protein SAQ01S_07250 [Sphingomonas aquatilis NBRC 16722]